MWNVIFCHFLYFKSWLRSEKWQADLSSCPPHTVSKPDLSHQTFWENWQKREMSFFVIFTYFKCQLRSKKLQANLSSFPSLSISKLDFSHKMFWVGGWMFTFVRMGVSNFLFTLGLLPRMKSFRGWALCPWAFLFNYILKRGNNIFWTSPINWLGQNLTLNAVIYELGQLLL